MTLIDRALGQSIPPGNWEGEFYRATHDSTGLDTGFEFYWPTLQGVRGTYHYANPDGTSGTAQAKLFCDRVLSQGWRAKTDIWALDMEGKNVALSGAALAQWINDFMSYATSKLGDRGFLYIGWPWLEAHGLVPFNLHVTYRWWLPAYGPNDGREHTYDSGGVTPVLHQFTSNPFDQSSIIDAARWGKLFAVPVPPPPPVITPTQELEDMIRFEQTVTLDPQGNGHLPIPHVKAADVGSWGVIGVADPDVAHGYPTKIPAIALTIGKDGFAEIVLEGGTPSAHCSVRALHK